MADKHPLEACKPVLNVEAAKKYQAGNLKRRQRVSNDHRRKCYRRSRVSLRHREGVENAAFDDDGDVEAVESTDKSKLDEKHCVISRRCLNFDDASESKTFDAESGMHSQPISSQIYTTQNIETTMAATMVLPEDQKPHLSLSPRSQSWSEKGCRSFVTPKRIPTFHQLQSSRKSMRHSKIRPSCAKSNTKSVKELQDMKQDGFPSHFLRSKIRFVRDDHVLEAFGTSDESSVDQVAANIARLSSRSTSSASSAATTSCPPNRSENNHQLQPGHKRNASSNGNFNCNALTGITDEERLSRSQENLAPESVIVPEEEQDIPVTSNGQHRRISSQPRHQNIEVIVRDTTTSNREQPGTSRNASQVQEYLPDILNAHSLPSYSTLPHIQKMVTSRTNVEQQIPQQSLLTTQAIATTETLHRLSRLEYERCSNISSSQRNECQDGVPSRRQTRPDDDPKHCCGSANAQSISFRWFIVMIAFAGLSCAIVGTVLGALKASGREHLTVALLMISVGIALIIVSGIAWRLTSDNAPSCSMMLGLHPEETVSNRRFMPRGSHLHGRSSHHPFAAMMYPEFQYRPPPPSYQASMQDYRLQAFLCDRLGSIPRIPRPSISPPPTYRSNCANIIARSALPLSRDSESNRPPDYRPHPSPVCSNTRRNTDEYIDCDTNNVPPGRSAPNVMRNVTCNTLTHRSNTSNCLDNDAQIQLASTSSGSSRNSCHSNMDECSTKVEIEVSQFDAKNVPREENVLVPNNDTSMQRPLRVEVEILAQV